MMSPGVWYIAGMCKYPYEGQDLMFTGKIGRAFMSIVFHKELTYNSFIQLYKDYRSYYL